MKQSSLVTSSRRKNRKAHFTAPSHIRRKLMSSHLSKELRQKHEARSIPIRKGDEVKVLRGAHKGQAGKVITVYRAQFRIHIEKLVRQKTSGMTVPIPIHPSNVEITKLKMNNDRRNILERKARTRKEKKGEKWSQKQLSSVD